MTRIIEATQALHKRLVLGQFNMQGGSDEDVQETQEEDSAKRYFLTCIQFQAPYYWYGETPDYKIDQQIRNSIPSVELVLIDTGAMVDRFVPVKRNRSALKYCDEDIHKKVEKYNGPYSCQ